MPKSLTALLVLGGLSTAAWAFPWDTDMADALFKRAYSWTMGPARGHRVGQPCAHPGRPLRSRDSRHDDSNGSGHRYR